MLFECRSCGAYFGQRFHKRLRLLKEVTPTPDTFVQAQQEANDLLVQRDLPSEDKPGLLLAGPNGGGVDKAPPLLRDRVEEAGGLDRTLGVADLLRLPGRARRVPSHGRTHHRLCEQPSSGHRVPAGCPPPSPTPPFRHRLTVGASCGPFGSHCVCKVWLCQREARQRPRETSAAGCLPCMQT